MLNSIVQKLRTLRKELVAGIRGGNEAFGRKCIFLMVSGNLNFSPPMAPLSVKSQDPSPADLLKNRQSYETFFFRSVYLPVIRSHGYDLLALLGFPNATTTVGQRSQTTVPTQALMMMNNPFCFNAGNDT